MSRISMVTIQVRWPELIRWPTLWPSSPHVVSSLLLWIGHRIGHANNLIKLTTLIRRMVLPTITTTKTLFLQPTLTLCMPSSTKRMELFHLHILTTLTSRRSLVVTLSILNLSLTSLVLYRCTTVHYLITVLSTPTKLTSVTRLATLNTPLSRSMSTRLNSRRRFRLLIPNHQ